MKNQLSKHNDLIISDFTYIYLRKITKETFIPKYIFRENSALYYVVNGEIECIKNDEIITLKKNDFLFWNYGDKLTSIRNLDNKDSLCYIIAFTLEPIETSHTEYGLPTYGNIQDEYFSNLFPKLYKLYNEQTQEVRFELYSILYNIFHKIISLANSADTLGAQYYKLRKVIQYIYTNYMEKFEIEKLCEISGYSKVHLTRLFREHYKSSPKKFLNDFRIQRAKYELEDASNSIADVAALTGFSDVGYFCRVFKNTTSYRPSEYREMYFSGNFNL